MLKYQQWPENHWNQELTFCQETQKNIIPARDPKQCGGAKEYETSGDGDDDDDDDDDDDTQMRALRSRHVRAHTGEHTYQDTYMKADIWKHTYAST